MPLNGGHPSHHDDSTGTAIALHEHRLGVVEKKVEQHDERIDQAEKRADNISGALAFLKWSVPLTGTAILACVGALWKVAGVMLDILQTIKTMKGQ